MSYTGFTTAADYLGGTLSTVYDTPITLVCWIKKSDADWQATAGSKYALALAEGDADWNPSFTLQAGANGPYAKARSTSGGISNFAYYNASAIRAAQLADKWVPLVGVFTSDTDRDCYVVNSSYTDNDIVETIVTGVLDTVWVGNCPQQDPMTTGSIAEVAIFTNAWDTTKVDHLQTSAQTGPNPRSIDAANCIGYWPLDTNLSSHPNQGSDSSGTLSENGTNVIYSSDHPTITNPLLNRIVEIPTGPLR